MKFGSMKEVLLTVARDSFLFNCRVAGRGPQTLNTYRDVLGSFITFTGDMLVKELTVSHVRAYIATLDDGSGKRQENIRLMNHYAVLHTWIRWLHVQELITERGSGFVKPPRLTDLFPLLSSTKNLAYCC